MAANSRQNGPPHDPIAELEHELIRAFVAGAGYDLNQLLTRSDPDATKLLASASRYASDKLGEIEARWRYLRALHGE